MKKLKLHNILIVLGFTLWFAETAYFGFNREAQSDLERYLDWFSLCLVIAGSYLAWCNKPTINKTTISLDKEFFEKIKEVLKNENN